MMQIIGPAKTFIKFEEKICLNMKTNTPGAKKNVLRKSSKANRNGKKSSSTCIPGETCTFSSKRQAAYKCFFPLLLLRMLIVKIFEKLKHFENTFELLHLRIFMLWRSCSGESVPLVDGERNFYERQVSLKMDKLIKINGN